MSFPTGSESTKAAGEAVAPNDTQDGNSEGHLRRLLGVPSLVLIGLVYMVPLTVFTTYGIVTQMTGGRLPTAYIVTRIAMVFTARSYALMARSFPFAGSEYTSTQRSFGPGIGFLTGWITVEASMGPREVLELIP